MRTIGLFAIFIVIGICQALQGCLPYPIQSKKYCKKSSSVKMTGHDTGLSAIMDLDGFYESEDDGAIKLFPNGEILWGHWAGVYSVMGDTIMADLYMQPSNILFGEWDIRKDKFVISGHDRIMLLPGQYSDSVEFRFKSIDFTPRVPAFIYSQNWLWNDKKIRKQYEKEYKNRRKARK